MISILVKYKKNFLLRKCLSQTITAKRPLHSDYKRNQTPKHSNMWLLLFEGPVQATVGFLWLLLAKGIARMLISRAGMLHTKILMQGAADNVPASSCNTDLADLVNTTLSSAQLQSLPLPTALLLFVRGPCCWPKISERKHLLWEGRTAQELLRATCHPNEKHWWGHSCLL